MLVIILLAVAAYAIYSCGASVTVDNTVVKTVDLNRYLGKWYEVARFDHSFERGMQQCTAIYTMQPNGKIKVTNEGTKGGKWKQTKEKLVSEAKRRGYNTDNLIWVDQ